MRRLICLCSALLLLAALAPVAPAAADLGAPVGTAPQVVVRQPMPGTLIAVRTGRHADYDRIVFEIRGSLPGWDVRYVRQLIQDPSGRPVPIAGNAILRVALTGVNGHDAAGRTTVDLTLSPRLPTLRQVRPAGDFEAVLSVGLGLSHRAGFRVFGLTNPTRVVVDVAH